MSNFCSVSHDIAVFCNEDEECYCPECNSTLTLENDILTCDSDCGFSENITPEYED